MDKKTKISFIALFVLQISNFFLIFFFMQTRPMLNSRAVIQTSNTEALQNAGAFTLKQQCAMRDAWLIAEYREEANVFISVVCPDDLPTK